MPFRDHPVRRHVRLADWDYRSPGPYAITIVTQHRAWFFGEVADGRVVFNQAGAMVEATWQETATAFPRVILDAFVVMPNHLHAIVVQSDLGPAGNPTLGDVVHRFKSVTTARYSTGVRMLGWEQYDRTLWQPRFYDHIIRSDEDMHRCRHYIVENPANWHTDQDREPNPNGGSFEPTVRM